MDNLVGNALKFSPTGGEVRVRVARDGGWAVLAVRDEGIGIPAEDRSRLFELFQRGTNIPGWIGGTGIGLASVRQIVGAHGGAVEVDSREGMGSTFTIRLPLAKNPSNDPGRGK